MRIYSTKKYVWYHIQMESTKKPEVGLWCGPSADINVSADISAIKRPFWIEPLTAWNRVLLHAALEARQFNFRTSGYLGLHPAALQWLVYNPNGQIVHPIGNEVELKLRFQKSAGAVKNSNALDRAPRCLLIIYARKNLHSLFSIVFHLARRKRIPGIKWHW